MRTLSCTGHEFVGKSENPWGVTSHWVCTKCGRKVISKSVMLMLTGEPQAAN